MIKEFTEKSVYPCWQCGGYTKRLATANNREERIYCDGCRHVFYSERKELLEEYGSLKAEIMWQRAVNNLEKQGRPMHLYYDESRYVLELALEDTAKFQSSHEMMAAMELLRKRVKTKVQHKILKYRVDFLLPDEKVVLEIDGKLHDFRVKKDSNRDVAIMNELNKDEAGWEIVRIPTKYIEQDVSKLLLAIRSVRKEKQRLRRKHDGYIPAYFSKRDATAQLDAVKNIKQDVSSREVKDKLENEWSPSEI